MTTTDVLLGLATSFDQRAKDRDEDAEVHAAAGKHDLAAYDTGMATAYRGAARAVRFQISQEES
jgi:hypothetical protein